jgi:hypothetical protein
MISRTMSDHLSLEIAAVFTNGRPMYSHEPVPGCSCETCCQRRVKMSHSWRLKMSHPPGSEELASGHGTLLGFATLLRGLVGRGGG